jgi:hypothetical protein
MATENSNKWSEKASFRSRKQLMKIKHSSMTKKSKKICDWQFEKYLMIIVNRKNLVIPEKNIVDLLANKCPQPQKLAINPMQDGLQ